jgi:transcriptional regulator with XRE-family HTH domain
MSYPKYTPPNPEHSALSMDIYIARRAKQLTQAELAKIVGTSQSVIVEAESSNGNPRLKTLLKIAEALDVHVRMIENG